MRSKSLAAPLIAGLVALATALLCDYGVRREQERLDQNQRIQVSSALGQFRAALESELNGTLYLTNGLVAYVATHTTLEAASVEPLLKALYDQGRYLRNLGLAPGNRLTYVYPREGNEKAIGLYYPDIPEQWPDVERAIRERKPRLAGPVTLKQGGTGFIYRVPVFIGPNQEYWGLLSTVIDEEQLFSRAGIAPLVNGLQLALRHKDGGGTAGDTFLGDPGLFATDAERATITTPGSSWELALRPVDGWTEGARLNWLRWAGWGLGLLIGWLAYQGTTAARRRRLAEQEIQLSRQQMNEAQRIARVGSWSLDMQTGELAWSDEIYRMFGIPPGTPLSLEAFTACIHPDDREGVLAAWNDSVDKGAEYDIEHRIVVEGQTLWIRERAEISRDAAGNPLQGVGTAQDITRQKLAEQSLEKLLAEQHAMLNNDLIGIVTVRKRVIAWANPAFEKMLGYAPGALTGAPTRQNYPNEESFQAFGAAAYPTLAAGQVFRMQTEHRRQDGEIVWLDFSGSMLDAESGETLWAVVDITERKRFEESAAQSEERMQLALSGAELGLWDLDIPSGRIAHNDRLMTMAGYLPDELEITFQTLPLHLHPDDLEKIRKAFYEHLKGNTPGFEMECRLRGRDDQWIWVLSRGMVVGRDARGRAMRMTGTNLDISERKRSEAALKARESRLATLVESMQDLVLVLDTGGTVIECFRPKHALRPTHLPPEQTVGKTCSDVFPPDIAARYDEALVGIIMDGQPRTFEYTLTIDGAEYISHATMSALAGDSVYPTGFLVVIRDITSERDSQREIERLAHHNALLLGSVGEGIYGVDLSHRITFVNSAARNMLRFAEPEMLGAECHELFHHHRQDGSAFPVDECPVRQTVDDGETRRSDNDWFWRKDGSGFPVSMTITPVVEQDRSVGAVVIFQDITERKANEARIHDLAFFDPLTKLPNRRLLLDRLDQALPKSARHGSHGAVLFLDLDNFKILNDTRGHDVGDLLLEEAGRRLQASVRACDTVARLGGDEFVVMLESLSADAETAAAQARVIGEKIREALGRSYLLNGYEHRCSASIGICLFMGSATPSGELLKRADAAMYQAKSSGRNRLQLARQD